uniref:SET domain-containing protein n=1 Tax=Setaria digitata TaxID=48799 RepID=A0A915Q0G0_9BILA
MSDTSNEKRALLEESQLIEEARKTDNECLLGDTETTAQGSRISQHVFNTNKDESEDANDPLLRKIIIDDDNDSKERDNGAEDAVIGLSYQDHNYGRRSGNVSKNDGEIGEKFPIIGGLASYIADVLIVHDACLGDDINKVSPGHRSRDASTGHLSRSHHYGTHYRKISEVDQRASGTAAGGGCRMNQMRKLPVPTSGQIFSRSAPIAAAQIYRSPHRVTQSSANSQADVLLRSRHFIGSSGAFGSSNKRVLRPAHPPTPALSTYRQSIRQVIPSKSISATMPAYATAVNPTNADSDTHTTDLSIGLAPFLVPSRRPRPVVRNRARLSREPEKGTEMMVQKRIVNDAQTDIVHEEQSNRITTPRQHLQKNIAHSGVVKQQYIMAEPLEPCHVPRLQHSGLQRACLNDESVASIVVDDKLSKHVQISCAAAGSKAEEQETFPQNLSADSREPVHVINEGKISSSSQKTAQGNAALPHHSCQDITKYIEEHCRKSRKESFVANSRQLLTRQLDELQMRQPRSRYSEASIFDSSKKIKEMVHVTHQSMMQSVINVSNVEGGGMDRQKPMSPGHVADVSPRSAALLSQDHEIDLQQQNLLRTTSAEAEGPILSSKNKASIGTTPTFVTLKKSDHKAPSVCSGDEPLVSNEACNVVVEQRVSAATRSSISGAEEETSVNGNNDEKETEDESIRIIENVASVNSTSNNSSSEDDWEEEYTTRCYCGLNHNDDFMIQCDMCNVWQHGKCMDIDRRRVPDTYKCEECNPRLLKLSKTQAREMQLKVLARQRREKEKRRRQKTKGHFKRIRDKSKEVRKRRVRGNPSKDYVECFKYEYTRSVMAFSRKHEDTGDHVVLEALRNADGVSVMFVTQVSMGLVSTRLYCSGEPVIYICGRVSLPNECRGREEPGTIIPFVILYSDLIVEENKGPIPICIDARQFGSKARFARTSCRPNIKLRHFFLKGKLHIVGTAAGNIERGEEITLPFDADYFMSKTKLVCACSADDEDDGSGNCLIRNFNRSLEQGQNQSSTTALKVASNSLVTTDAISKGVKKHYMELGDEKVQTSIKSKNKSSSGYFSMERIGPGYSDGISAVGAVEISTAVTPTTEDENGGNKDMLSGSSIEMDCSPGTTGGDSPKKSRSKQSKLALTGSSYRKRGNIKLRHRGTAVRRTVETNEFIDSVKNSADSDCSLKNACPSNEAAVRAEERDVGKELNSSSKECEGPSVEEDKSITEKLRTSAIDKMKAGSVQKSTETGARSGIKNGSKTRRKRKTSLAESAIGAVAWGEKSEGSEQSVILDGSAKKVHRKRGDLLEESREERKVLQELALFERMQQREAKRQQHVVPTRRSNSTGSGRSRTSSSNGLMLESKVVKVADNASDERNIQREEWSQCGPKRAKKVRGRRPVSSSDYSSSSALKRSRTMSEGAKQEEKSEGEQGLNSELIKKVVSFSLRSQIFNADSKSESKMEGNLREMTVEERRSFGMATDNTAVSPADSSLLNAKQEIQHKGSVRENSAALCCADEKQLKYEIDNEPSSKRKRRSYSMDKQNPSSTSEKASHDSDFGRTDSLRTLQPGEIRAFFRRVIEIETSSEPSDFLLVFQTAQGVQLPSTSFHSGFDKNQMKPVEVPKKKMSLDEYKRRKSSKTVVDSEKTSKISTENKTEDSEPKQVPLSRSFIPTMSASEGPGRRTSLRLGAIPDPMQLRATPTLSIDDLKRRIYRRTTLSNPVTSNSDGISPPFLVQKNASHTSPGQLFEEGPTSCAQASSLWRREPPPAVTSNRDKRLPLEERLRLVLGCGEGYADRYSSSVSPPAAPPPPPPPPPPLLPVKSSEMSKLRSDLSGDVHSDIPLPPPPPSTTTGSYSCGDQHAYESHSLGSRTG